MRKRVERYIPHAIKAVERNFGTRVKKQFKGYIASFGAAVIQTGLIPAVAFYSVQAGAEEDRGKIVEAIKEILKETKEAEISQQSLLKFLIERYENGDDMNRWKEKVMDAATALKLAVRIFAIDDHKNSTSDENLKN